MTDESLGLELFQQHREDLLRRFLELERQNLPADVVERQLVESAEAIVRDHNTSALITGKAKLSDEDARTFLANVRGLTGGGPLVPLLEREDVENIHILGHDNVVLSLADGNRIPGPPLAGSEGELVTLIRHLAATAGHTSRRFDTASPLLDLRLASGHRMFAVTAVAERTSVVIRRHRMLNSSLERLQQSGTVTDEMIPVLRAAVRPPNPANMLVVGGTGAGKTTLLRSLLAEVPQSELIVTIEDTLELHLGSSGLHERTLALETRTTNTEGTGEISMYDLCKAALRMSPDRVIVGEVRGGEVMQLLQAMGIGNDGSLGTIHAGSTRAAINKILIYAQRSPDAPTPDSVLREIAEVLHLLVYIKKLPDGRRAVTSIREVVGFDDGKVMTSEVFAPGPDGVGVYTTPFKADGEPLARLIAAGFDPATLGEPFDHQRGRLDRARQASPGATRPQQPPAAAPRPPQPVQPAVALRPQAPPARPQRPLQPARPAVTAPPAPNGPRRRPAVPAPAAAAAAPRSGDPRHHPAESNGAPPADPRRQPAGSNSAPPADPRRQPAGSNSTPAADPRRQPAGSNSAPPADPRRQPAGSSGAGRPDHAEQPRAVGA